MATIKYQLQSDKPNSPIYIRFTLGSGKGKDLKRKTGYICNPQDWSNSTNFPKTNTAQNKQIQTNLKSLESFVFQKFNNDNAKGTIINGDWLIEVIDLFHGRKEPEKLDFLIEYGNHFIERLPYKSEVKNRKMGVDKRTITKYQTIVNKLSAFQDYKKKNFLVKDVNLDFREDFLKYLLNVDKISNNTAGRYLSHVKTIVVDARKNGIKTSPQIDNFKGFEVEADKVIFTFEEIEKIKNTHFENESYNLTRDWFVIGCYLGQRASDLFRITSKMIESVNGFDFVSITQRKTGQFVQIPIHTEVRKILNERNGEFPPKFAENLESCTTLFNRYIKQVCRIAEIDDLTLGSLHDEETGRYERKEYPKWMLASSHSCRRSFASNFYAQREYPTPLLMSVTGHTTESMFLTYIGKKPIDYALQLAQIWSEKATEQEKQKSKEIKLTPLKLVNE